MALWVAYGIVLDPGPPPGGSCTTGLYPGAYGDSLVPVHLVAYAVFVGLIVWSGPPGRVAIWALAGTAVVVLVSLVWSGPVVVLGIVALIASVPVAIAAAVLLWAVLRRGRADLVHVLLWTGLVIGLPATFMGAYLNGAGLFCF